MMRNAAFIPLAVLMAMATPSVAEAKEAMIRCEVTSKVDSKIGIKDPPPIDRYFVLNDSTQTIDTLVDGQRRSECAKRCKLTYGDAQVSWSEHFQTPEGVGSTSSMKIDRLTGKLVGTFDMFNQNGVIARMHTQGLCTPVSLTERKF